MNTIQILVSEPWVGRLGMTLLHFLWQGLCVAVLYEAARRTLARTSGPQTRYRLACVAMAAMMAAPFVTWELMAPSDKNPEAVYRIPRTPQAASTTGTAATTTLPDSVRATVSSVPPEQFLFWVVVIWLTGAIAFWVRLVGGWVVTARMRSMLVRGASPEWRERFGKLGEQIGISRPVGLLISALVQVPTVVGWLRPVVLVPVGALGGLPAEHVEALLLHELAHIRRYDYPINILQSVAESLLFYHPAVWWVSGHIRAERELCCDDLAVSISGDALKYAQALAQLESYRPVHFGTALAANGGTLANRIARLLGRPRPTAPIGLGPSLLAIAVLLGAMTYGLLAQSNTHPAFEAASIKRSPLNIDPNQPMGGGYQPGGLLHMVNMPLKGLIQFAYADHDSPHWLPLPDSQVVGGPAWAKTDGYNIDAKPERQADPKHTWLMLQALLADRFHLALNRETRELPVYDLEPVEGGPRLPAAKDAGCVSFPPGTPPRPVPGKVDCGYVGGPFSRTEAGLLHIQGRRVRVADLARELTSLLGRPVVDRTGFTGEFDLNLRFTADEALVGFLGLLAPADSHLPTDPNSPNIFAALTEQLGLKLVQARGSVEGLVIDRAERPTEN
ncbi:MAG TPA: M56 family metallopeptidase [Bryobacteraceae bacterium]|nr:M56 family metallopeptidase [Bryobacteraceae bacterium]